MIKFKEKTMQQPDELLSPEKLQLLLLDRFEIYLNKNKPTFLQNNTAIEATGADKATSDQPKDGSISAMSKLSGSVRRFTSGIFESTRTHAPLVKFFREEMADILSQKASSLTKMTNLSILFYGLYSYILCRNSADLRPLLAAVDQLLWASCPFVKHTQNMAQCITSLCDELAKKQFDEVFQLHYCQDLPLKNLLKNSNQERGAAFSVQADRLQFFYLFANEIIAAHAMISLNFKLTEKIDAEKPKHNSALGEIPVLGTYSDPPLPWARDYRCCEEDNITTWSALATPVWDDEHPSSYYPRLDYLHISRENGWKIIGHPKKYTITPQEIRHAHRPSPCMGNIYGAFLANWDQNIQQQVTAELRGQEESKNPI
jgi:hypothetical protein